MRLLGYFLVAIGVVLAIALFLTNSGMSEGDIIKNYWYVVFLCLGMVIVGGIMTMLEKS